MSNMNNSPSVAVGVPSFSSCRASSFTLTPSQWDDDNYDSQQTNFGATCPTDTSNTKLHQTNIDLTKCLQNLNGVLTLTSSDSMTSAESYSNTCSECSLLNNINTGGADASEGKQGVTYQCYCNTQAVKRVQTSIDLNTVLGMVADAQGISQLACLTPQGQARPDTTGPAPVGVAAAASGASSGGAGGDASASASANASAGAGPASPAPSAAPPAAAPPAAAPAAAASAAPSAASAPAPPAAAAPAAASAAPSAAPSDNAVKQVVDAGTAVGKNALDAGKNALQSAEGETPSAAPSAGKRSVGRATMVSNSPASPTAFPKIGRRSKLLGNW